MGRESAFEADDPLCGAQGGGRWLAIGASMDPERFATGVFAITVGVCIGGDVLVERTFDEKYESAAGGEIDEVGGEHLVAGLLPLDDTCPDRDLEVIGILNDPGDPVFLIDQFQVLAKLAEVGAGNRHQKRNGDDGVKTKLA